MSGIVNLQIESQDIQDAVLKVLNKQGTVADISPFQGIKIKVKFQKEEDAKKVREAKKNLKVAGNFELHAVANKKHSLHFVNPHGAIKGADFDQLAKEISKPLSQLNVVPQSITPKLSTSIVLQFGSGSDRNSAMDTLRANHLTVRGKTVTEFLPGFPKKQSSKRKKSKKDEGNEKQEEKNQGGEKKEKNQGGEKKEKKTKQAPKKTRNNNNDDSRNSTRWKKARK